MCQIDGYVHQPFKCIWCRADLVVMSFLEAQYTKDIFVLFLCTLQTEVYHLEYIVSNMTKKYLLRRISPNNYSYTRMTEN